MSIIIVDLDGCLCNDSKRLHHLEKGDLDSYHKGISEDTCSSHLRSFITGEHHVTWYFTARPAKYRPETLYWLIKHVPLPKTGPGLFMRPEGDKRTGAEVKCHLLEICLMQKFFKLDDIFCIFDNEHHILIKYQKYWDVKVCLFNCREQLNEIK